MNLNIRSLRALCARSIPSIDKKKLYQKSIEFGHDRISATLSRRNLSNQKSVIIIGAGLAGLFCAWLLKNLGYKVTILEARNRIGGRVYTIRDGQNIIEAGAEHIGLNHPLFLYLVKHFGLSLECSKVPTLNPDTLTINDQEVDHTELRTIDAEINKILMKISSDAFHINHPSKPWAEPSAIRDLDYISIRNKFDQWNFHGKARTILEKNIESDNLGPISSQSYLGLLCQIKGNGYMDTSLFWDAVELFKCSQGNQALANSLAHNLDIKYSSPVRMIKYANNRVYATTDRNTYFADYMVMTAPPSTWTDIVFDTYLDMSLYKPTTGSAIKVLPNIGRKKNCLEKLSNNLALFMGGPNITNDRVSNYVIKELHDNQCSILTNILVLNWPKEKYTKCGYSYAAIGKSTTVNRMLYFPVPQFNNRLLFAGEHTQVNFIGFMEGALQSGLRAANQIVDLGNN